MINRKKIQKMLYGQTINARDHRFHISISYFGPNWMDFDERNKIPIHKIIRYIYIWPPPHTYFDPDRNALSTSHTNFYGNHNYNI